MESVFKQALAHHKAGRLEAAEPLYRQAAAWKPAWALGNLGALLRTTGRLDEAEAVLREALAADPGNVPVRHTLGMTLLQAGQYVEGWRLYEARHEITAPPAVPFPRWQGEDLRGKRLLVVSEQGLGDQILLSRFLPLAAARAAEVQFAATRALVRLISPLGVPVFHPQSWDGVAADYWTPLGSLPRWLEAGPADAPVNVLARAPQPVAGVGLMLDGAAINGNNLNRLPPPAVAGAIRGLAAFTDLSPQATGVRDFAETADIVAGLERVVTVDTSVAHLAGSMGKACWVLMARPAIDWWTHWADDRADWYPSVRLIRQRTAGDWAGVLGDLARVLAAPADLTPG
jgi:hypothetical protein